MSDAITISSGGAVAVDTDALDAAAAALERTAERLRAAAGHLTAADERIRRIAFPVLDLLGRAGHAADRVAASAARADELGASLRLASATYALVDARVARDLAALAGDTTGLERAQRDIDAIEAQWPDAAALADDAAAHASFGGEAIEQLLVGGIVGAPFGLTLLPALAAALAGVRALGIGTVDRGRTVRPGGRAATLLPLPTSQAVTAPRTLGEAAARIPADGAARVRVEQYALSTGGRAFAVYISGTRAGRSEVWDLGAGIDALSGQGSDALATVEAALARAGAAPGDELYVWGHSLGGMLGAQLQQSSRYDVAVVGTFGAPTAVAVGAQTLSVQVRHADDPVAAMATGHETRVGAPGSFVVERTVDPAVGVHDLGLPAHHLDTYVETARTVDASGDPRVAALHERLAALDDAELVHAVEYGAERERLVAGPRQPPVDPGAPPREAPRGRVIPSAWGAG